MPDDENLKSYKEVATKMAELSKEINHAMRPLVEKQIQLSKVITDSIVGQSPSITGLTSDLQGLMNEMRVNANVLQEMQVAPVLEIAEETTKLFHSSIVSITSSLTQIFSESFEKLPDRFKDAFLTFSEHGWYVDLEIPLPDIWEIEEMFRENHTAKGDEALGRYFEGRRGEIEKYICDNYPHRRNLITSAFKAHKSGDYALSIPVFFAQADGICKDNFKRIFFKKNKKRLTDKYFKEIASDSLLEALTAPLERRVPEGKDNTESKKSLLVLRHMVMHGESLDYGTKINSLKAVSLINYISTIIEYK